MAHPRRPGGFTSAPASGGHANWFIHHYIPVLEALFLAVVGLNLLDLWSSSVAYSRGFSEGNAVILAVGGVLGTQVAGGLVVAKTSTMIGALVAATFGIMIASPRVKEVAVAVLAFMTVVLSVVSLNNLWVLAVG